MLYEGPGATACQQHHLGATLYARSPIRFCRVNRRDHGGRCLPYLSLRFKIGEPSCFRWIDSPCSGLSRQLAAAPLYALQSHTPARCSCFRPRLLPGRPRVFIVVPCAVVPFHWCRCSTVASRGRLGARSHAWPWVEIPRLGRQQRPISPTNTDPEERAAQSALGLMPMGYRAEGGDLLDSARAWPLDYAGIRLLAPSSGL